MDPNAALYSLRIAIASGEYEIAADYTEALDEWLSEGGFLPSAWERGK